MIHSQIGAVPDFWQLRDSQSFDNGIRWQQCLCFMLVLSNQMEHQQTDKTSQSDGQQQKEEDVGRPTELTSDENGKNR